jgi:hypothetical protein
LKVKQKDWTVGDERWTRRISVKPNNRPAVVVDGDGGRRRGK